MAANNQSNVIYPILLCGGSGTRLWPSSRKSYPKQFAKLIDDDSLFQKSVQRVLSNTAISFHKPTAITNSDFRFIVAEQLSMIAPQGGDIIIEPSGKNTAPAILAACLHIAKTDPEGLILISPSDHLIDDLSVFHQAILRGIDSAKAGNIVTFGVTPTRPETGYGYLEIATPAASQPLELVNFIEKPDLENAKQMLSSGLFLWNAGIFLFRACDMIAAFEAHHAKMLDHVTKATDNAQNDLDFIRLAPEPWDKCDTISIDYAIMEHITNRIAVPLSSGWDDLGSWDAIWQKMPKDNDDVATSDNTTAIDCQNVLLRSETGKQHLVGLGLDNIIAIATSDAVLVANKDRVQDVRTVVETLKRNDIAQAETFPIDHRPWGWFETLIITALFQVKHIYVKPGASLSLQSHKYRSEHWVVIKGTASVTIDEAKTDLAAGQSTFIPLGAKHRLENEQDDGLEIIEVQLGTYLGEDDITRYDDNYART